MSDRQNTNIQQSILTLLAFAEPHGQRIAPMLESMDFDEVYQPIASRLLAFREEYKKGPGIQHIDDCLGTLISGDSRTSGTYRQILSDMMVQNEQSLNAEYIIAETAKWRNKQNRKRAIFAAASEMQSQGDSVDLDRIDTILREAIKKEVEGDDSLFLNSPNALDFLTSFEGAEQLGYSLGIPLFDRCKIRMVKGEMLLLIGPKGAGKSWFLIHSGTAGFTARAKVLHVSLEMNAKRVCQRYMQAFFKIAVSDADVVATEIMLNKLGELDSWESRDIAPNMFFEDPEIREKLNAKWKGKYQLGRLLIKSFPMRSLTVPALESYLEFIELKYKFVPDIVLVDYPDLMKIGADNRRIETGIVFEELRGLADVRQFALVCVTQSSREGAKATTVKGFHVAEDWSKMMTTDIGITLSRTEQEKKVNLARLFVDKNRNARDGMTFLISQLYDIGQFVYNDGITLIDPYKYDKQWEEGFELDGGNHDDD